MNKRAVIVAAKHTIGIITAENERNYLLEKRPRFANFKMAQTPKETKMANTLYDAQIKLLNERVMQLETRSTITEKTVGDAYWEGRRDTQFCIGKTRTSDGFWLGLFIGLCVGYVIFQICIFK